MKQESKKTFTQINIEQRFIIRDRLRHCFPLSRIAAELNISPSSVSREIQRNRTRIYPSSKTFPVPECVQAPICKDNCTGRSCPSYHFVPCQRTEKAPFVCDSCPSKYPCRNIKYYYIPKDADNRAVVRRTDKVPIKLSSDDLASLDDLVCERIKQKKQSPFHLFASNEKNISISLSTFYRYTKNGLLNTRYIDLPMAVRYSPRYVPKSVRYKDKTYRIGRTFEDFSKALNEGSFNDVVEMDTVLGLITDKQAILTFCFRNSGLFLCYRLERKNLMTVRRKLLELQKSLGEELFKNLFNTILTDNGPEFTSPEILEKNAAHQKLVSLFFCDPYASGQKGKLEKTHVLLRRFIPKKQSIANVSQAQLDLIRDNINALQRQALGGLSSYQLFVLQYGQEVADSLGLNRISPDKVSFRKI
jgi:transposase, IS30 family